MTSKTDLDVAPQGAPPPAYQAALKASPSNTITKITTLNGVLAVHQSYRLVHRPAPHLEDRRVWLYDGASDSPCYTVSFGAPIQKTNINKMTLRRGNMDGPTEAIVTMPPIDNVLGVLTLGANKIQIKESRRRASIRAAQAAANKGDEGDTFKFDVGDLSWRLTKRYLHEHKGRSRAGDLELTDQFGNVVAVFLNQWTGSPNAKELGSLHLITSAGMDGEGRADLLPLALMSALVVIVHLSYRDRDSAKDILDDVVKSTLFACSVM